jgi:surface antigen
MTHGLLFRRPFWFVKQRMAVRLGVVLTAVSVVAGLALFAPPSAHANTRVVTVNTGGGPVNVREGTGTNTRLLRTIPNKTRVTIVCYLRGQVFNGGPYGASTNIWNRLDSGGYVTDGMLETGSNNPVVPGCSGSGPAPAPAPGRATGQTRNFNAGASGQCTYGAYQKWFEASATRNYPALTGSAKDWANSARATGWTVVLDAEPRSIVVFQPGVYQADRTYGHVAWVNNVEKRADGRYINITEMNYGLNGSGLNRWHSRTVKDIPGMSYILQP